jgi:hypothetical protein
MTSPLQVAHDAVREYNDEVVPPSDMAVFVVAQLQCVADQHALSVMQRAIVDHPDGAGLDVALAMMAAAYPRLNPLRAPHLASLYLASHTSRARVAATGGDASVERLLLPVERGGEFECASSRRETHALRVWYAMARGRVLELDALLREDADDASNASNPPVPPVWLNQLFLDSVCVFPRIDVVRYLLQLSAPPLVVSPVRAQYDAGRNVASMVESLNYFVFAGFSARAAGVSNDRIERATAVYDVIKSMNAVDRYVRSRRSPPPPSPSRRRRIGLPPLSRTRKRRRVFTGAAGAHFGIGVGTDVTVRLDFDFDEDVDDVEEE